MDASKPSRLRLATWHQRKLASILGDGRETGKLCRISVLRWRLRSLPIWKRIELRQYRNGMPHRMPRNDNSPLCDWERQVRIRRFLRSGVDLATVTLVGCQIFAACTDEMIRRTSLPGDRSSLIRAAAPFERSGRQRYHFALARGLLEWDMADDFVTVGLLSEIADKRRLNLNERRVRKLIESLKGWRPNANDKRRLSLVPSDTEQRLRQTIEAHFSRLHNDVAFLQD